MRKIAISEIRDRNYLIKKEKAIGIRYESSINEFGKPIQRAHRVVSEYNDKGVEIVKDVANYKNASEIFDLTQDFIIEHITVDLNMF